MIDRPKFYLDIPFVDGSLRELAASGSGKNFIQQLVGDDHGAPPRALRLEVTTDSGKKVSIVVPYDGRTGATVVVDGVEL